jgi:KUP system potassium uptake protein
MTSANDKNNLSGLTLAALGVVYGDIGTSPLYTLRECLHAHSLAPSELNVLGVLSLIFWTVLIVVTLKYVQFVMRADNNGEGGILALLALALRPQDLAASTRRNLMYIGLIGAALFYGDGIITPAISVLSAVEGLEIVTPLFKPYVVPITLVILIALFWIQRRGTAVVGKAFGPVMVLWFLVLAFMGIFEIVAQPGVLLAINPLHAYEFFHVHPQGAFVTLGAVVLAVTGGEALYADMGHFGVKPIRLAWYALVLPALMLNYFGQGALVLTEPEAIKNPFFYLAAPWAQLPMVILATCATIIASQAVISGAYSLTHQALQLGYLPRSDVRHTSESERGQIYLPAVNWLLLLGVVWLVVTFRSSSNLAAAYGIAVTGTMLMTTVLMFFVCRYAWGWSTLRSLSLCGGLIIVDGLLFAANTPKLPEGGWFPIVVGGAMFTIMATWRRGRAMLYRKLQPMRIQIDEFLTSIAIEEPPRVEGTAVFMAAPGEGVPHALMHNLKHNKILHERVVILTILVGDVPRIPRQERYELKACSHGFYHLTVRVGFMEFPDVPRMLNECKDLKPPCRLMETSFFLSRLRVIATEEPGMALWRERLFAAMVRNAAHATDFFRIPPNRVLEFDLRVHI